MLRRVIEIDQSSVLSRKTHQIDSDVLLTIWMLSNGITSRYSFLDENYPESPLVVFPGEKAGCSVYQLPTGINNEALVKLIEVAWEYLQQNFKVLSLINYPDALVTNSHTIQVGIGLLLYNPNNTNQSPYDYLIAKKQQSESIYQP